MHSPLHVAVYLIKMGAFYGESNNKNALQMEKS